jgi:hypothetical protein
MARSEFLDVESMLGGIVPNADMFFNLGMTYSNGPIRASGPDR